MFLKKFYGYRLFLWINLKYSKRILTFISFLFIIYFFSSCKKKSEPYYRINLTDNWYYSTKGDPYPFFELPDNNFNSLSNLLDNKIGYVFLRTSFVIPKEYRHKDLALYIGRIKIASKIYFNNHSIGNTGTFPPHEFTEGNRSFAFKIPKEYVNFGGENTIMICLWCHGYGSIESTPFLSEYNDALKTADSKSFLYSKIYFILTIILLIINLIYLFLYLLRRSEIENMSFSQVCLFTGLYLVVFYYGEYSFLGKANISYLLFEKIFKGATAILSGYMIVCFARDFLHYQESRLNKIIRFLITVVGITIPMTATNIPDFRNRLRIGFIFIIFQFIFLGKVFFVSIKNKDKRIIHFALCLSPFLIAFISQIIAKISVNQKIDTLLLAISWVTVIFLFLAILIMRFVQLANEVEYMNKNLENLVTERTDALEKEKNRAIKEIDLAGFVQRSFYKFDTSEVKDWNIQITSKPMSGVSGDLYTAFINNNQLNGFGIFDISGHGIASGLVTMLVKNIIEQEFNKGLKQPLNKVMATINKRIISEKGNIENYLTGLLIRFNNNDIELVNAGHPKAILYQAESGKISYIEEEGINQFGAIGIADFPINFETIHFNMKSGDELVLYTDGISECMNADKKYFGNEGIMAVFKNNIGRPIKDQVDALPAALRKFSGSDNFNDDITYIILKKM